MLAAPGFCCELSIYLCMRLLFFILGYVINTGQTELADSAQCTAIFQIKTIHSYIHNYR